MNDVLTYTPENKYIVLYCIALDCLMLLPLYRDVNGVGMRLVMLTLSPTPTPKHIIALSPHFPQLWQGGDSLPDAGSPMACWVSMNLKQKQKFP